MPENEKKKWNYFTDDETKNLDTEFVARLDMARHRAGVPFVITSGYRTPEQNFAVGGVSGSSHEKGLAVDLHCRNSNQLWHILDGLYSVGFNRVGIYFVIENNIPYPTHVHVDSDLTKPKEVAFLKIETAPGQINS